MPMPAVFSSILAAILGIVRASINALSVLATSKTPTGPPVVVLAGREVTLHQPALVQLAACHTVNLMASDGSNAARVAGNFHGDSKGSGTAMISDYAASSARASAST